MSTPTASKLPRLANNMAKSKNKTSSPNKDKNKPDEKPAPSTNPAPAAPLKIAPESDPPLPPANGDRSRTDFQETEPPQTPSKQVAHLESANVDLYNIVSEREATIEILRQENETLRNDKKALRTELSSLEKDSAGASTESSKEINRLTESVEALDRDKVNLRERYEEVKSKVESLQTLYEVAESTLQEREDELQKLREFSEQNLIRLQHAEQELADQEELVRSFGPAREMLEVVNDKLGQVFADMDKQLTPHALIEYFDSIEESRIPETRSSLSLSSDHRLSMNSARSANRKVSVSDELDRVGEDMEDEDDGDLTLNAKYETYDNPIITLGRTTESPEKRDEELQQEEDELKESGRPDQHEVNTKDIKLAAHNASLGRDNEILEAPAREGGTRDPGNASPRDPEGTTRILVETNEQLVHDVYPTSLWKTMLYSLLPALLFSVLLFIWKDSEKRMWHDANYDPGRAGDLYHHHFHSASSPGLWGSIEPGWFVNWIEHSLLGYLETLPG